MMGGGAREMTGARLRGSFVRDGQGFDFERRHLEDSKQRRVMI